MLHGFQRIDVEISKVIHRVMKIIKINV